MPMGKLRNSLLFRFSLMSLLVFIALAVFLDLYLGRSLKDQMLHSTIEEARFLAEVKLFPALPGGGLAQPLEGSDYEQFLGFIQQNIDPERTARVKVWNRAGQVIFSTDRAQVGQVFPIKPALGEALSGGVEAVLWVPYDAENEGERPLGALLEVYVPVRGPGGEVLGAFEVYRYYEPMAQMIAQHQRTARLGVGVSFAFLYIALFLVLRVAGSRYMTNK
jgi:hypothetical protein